MQDRITKEKQFEEIYRAYRNDVYKISLYFTEDEYIADDITQKAFLNLYLHLDSVNLKSIHTYLLRTARNMSYNWKRDMKWEYQGEYIDNMPEERIILRSAEDNYIKEERDERIKQFLLRILEELAVENESWSEIVTLIFVLGKSHEEVAKELCLTIQVVYSKFYRAKQWIRKKYETEFIEVTEETDQ